MNLLDTIEMALTDLNRTGKIIALFYKGEKFESSNMKTIKLDSKFDVKRTLKLIGTSESVGIIKNEHLDQGRLQKLVDILGKNNVTTVILNSNPFACEVIYPEPQVGTKHIENNYEYCYGKGIDYHGLWSSSNLSGWGVKIIDNTLLEFESPLTTIQHRPVVDMAYLFARNKEKMLVLNDWDTSRVKSMEHMFYCSEATEIIGLDKFDTSMVTNMSYMFFVNTLDRLDLGSFNTSKTKDMEGMFSQLTTKSLDLSSFDVSRVINMNDMFTMCRLDRLDLSSFVLSRKISVPKMFHESNIVELITKNKEEASKFKNVKMENPR